MNLGTWWSHVDPAIAGGLVGGLVGGVATLIGGFGGALLVGRLETRREERQQLREHGAAVRAVLYEMTTILSGVAVAMKDHSFLPSDMLPEWAYQSVNPNLLARLPGDVAQAVGLAYSELPVLRRTLSPPDFPNWDVVELLGNAFARAHQKLKRYGEQSLGMDFGQSEALSQGETLKSLVTAPPEAHPAPMPQVSPK